MILGFLPVDSFNVIVLAAVFVLVATGLHFTFGMLNVVNLVHGELILIGAYTTLQVQKTTGNVLLGMALAPLLAGVVGLAMERGVLRFLYERPLDSLLATFGLALIIRQVVQFIFSPNPQTVRSPIGGSFLLGGFNIPWWRLVIVLVTAGLLVGVIQFLKRSRFGLQARATVANPVLAETMGINSGAVRAGLFALGSAIAGLAGAMLAPISTLNPQFGLLFLVNSFLVVIIGGKGSLRGLVVAGVVLGGTLAALQFVMSTVLAQILILAIAIIGVRVRPLLGIVREAQTKTTPAASTSASAR
ncbi:MAG: branched-chain amino acid ABC transporter permease [Acidimicrobiia bacterium]